MLHLERGILDIGDSAKISSVKVIKFEQDQRVELGGGVRRDGIRIGMFWKGEFYRDLRKFGCRSFEQIFIEIDVSCCF